jgi:hypothetical protein
MVFDGQAQGSGVDLFGTPRPLHVWKESDTYYLIDTSKQSYNAAFDPVADPQADMGTERGRSDQVTRPRQPIS